MTNLVPRFLPSYVSFAVQKNGNMSLYIVASVKDYAHCNGTNFEADLTLGTKTSPRMEVVPMKSPVQMRAGNTLTKSFRVYVVKTMTVSTMLVTEVAAAIYLASLRPLIFTFTLRDVKARIMTCSTNL